MAGIKRGDRQHHREPQHPLSQPHHPTLDAHSHKTHHLLYLITFLLIILVLVVFFSFPFPKSPTQTTYSPFDSTIDSLSCQWQDDHFVVCETVSWSGADVSFAKGYIPGGESLEASPPQTASTFTYCQPVGTEEGYVVARALLYSSQEVLRDIGQGVQCLGKSSPTTKQPSSQTIPSYVTTTGFRAYPRNPTFPRGEGIFTKTFPGKVRSCTFTGTWVTNNDQRFNQRNTCHEGKGTFKGAADARSQYVINDPEQFIWAGTSQALLNPPATRYDGYSFWMETCDNEYYKPNHVPRYGVQGTITGFGTNTLAFTWNYYDENVKPAVDFAFSLDCILSSMT